jgi:hypothetical protein
MPTWMCRTTARSKSACKSVRARSKSACKSVLGNVQHCTTYNREQRMDARGTLLTCARWMQLGCNVQRRLLGPSLLAHLRAVGMAVGCFRCSLVTVRMHLVTVENPYPGPTAKHRDSARARAEIETVSVHVLYR